ncbi:MAG: nitrate- and nitrite sensing domain-containing protein [Pseudomonadota bacterium]
MARLALNTAISTRILFLCLIPMVALIFVGFLKLADERTYVTKAQFVKEVALVAPAVSDLVHELQKERGTSAGFIGSKGEIFADQIVQQRIDTDAKLQVFMETFQSLSAALQTPIFQAPVDRSQSRLAELGSKRMDVDRFDLTVAEMAGYYTPLIRDLLNIIESMTIIVDDGDALRSVSAFSALLQGKERAGVERAMGANGFGSGTFSPGVYQNFVRLGALQESFFDRFKKYASSEEIALFEQNTSGAEEAVVAGMREAAQAAPFGGDISGISGPEWFAASTARIDLLKEVEVLLTENIAETAAGSVVTANRTFWLLALMLTALIGLTFVVSYLVARSIAPPLRRLARTMSELANNNTDVEIDGVWRVDEIGDMARAVQVFKENAIDRLELEKQAQVDRDRERARQSHIEGVVSTFRQNIKNVTSSVSDQADGMRSSADKLAAVAEDAAANASSADNASASASGNVQTVAVATEELTASIQEIAGQTARVSELMNAASDRAGTTSQQVSVLSTSAERIGAVVKLISDIAEQTNLLALNATIEAARAGEAGRGFSVVASEVKELADQTAKATDEISSQIAGIQNSTSNTVDSIEGITAAINEIAELTTAIAGAVEEQQAATQEIATSISAASDGTSTVAGNVASVTESIGVTSGEANRVNESANMLTSATDQLISNIEEFLHAVTSDVNERRGALRVKMSECVVISSEGRRRRTRVIDGSTSGARITPVDDVKIGDTISIELGDGRTLKSVVRRFADDGIGVEFSEQLQSVDELIGKGMTESEAA